MKKRDILEQLSTDQFVDGTRCLETKQNTRLSRPKTIFDTSVTDLKFDAVNRTIYRAGQSQRCSDCKETLKAFRREGSLFVAVKVASWGMWSFSAKWILGKCNIFLFGKTTKVLRDSIIWTDKETLTTQQILRYPHIKGHIILETEWRNTRGVFQSQLQQGLVRVIGYFCKTLSKSRSELLHNQKRIVTSMDYFC